MVIYDKYGLGYSFLTNADSILFICSYVRTVNDTFRWKRKKYIVDKNSHNIIKDSARVLFRIFSGALLSSSKAIHFFYFIYAFLSVFEPPTGSFLLYIEKKNNREL